MMTPLIVAIGSLIVMFCAALLGMALRAVLPEHQASTAFSDTVTRSLGLAVTLTVFVLGFSINSAKGYRDDIQDKLSRMASDVVVLDRTLVRYGPETGEARELLHQSLGTGIRTLWPGHATQLPALAQGRSIDGLEQLENKISDLPGREERQRLLQSTALQTTKDIIKTTSLYLTASQTGLQTPMLAILALWLVIIFLGFGLLAPRNGSAIAVLLVSALPASGAIFLVLELYNPFSGLMHIPPSALEVPLESIAQ